jgi:hypothetical protein
MLPTEKPRAVDPEPDLALASPTPKTKTSADTNYNSDADANFDFNATFTRKKSNKGKSKAINQPHNEGPAARVSWSFLTQSCTDSYQQCSTRAKRVVNTRLDLVE